jgi:hypothetical protein
MAHYKTIYGVKYDAELLEKIENAVADKSDGRIGLKCSGLASGSKRMEISILIIEKVTMKYIRDNFKWTEEAYAWFRSQIAEWAAEKR